MHKPESFTENETHNILWGFNIQTYHLIRTNKKKTDLVLINKKKKKRICRSNDPKERMKDSETTNT